MRSSLRSRAFLLAVPVVGALAACDAPTVPADSFGYDPTQLTGGLYYHWGRGRTIAVYARTPETNPSGIDLVAATREAMARWNGVSRYGEFRLVHTTDPRAADVAVRFRDDLPIVDLLDCSTGGSGGGRTLFCAAEADTALTFPLRDGGGGRIKMDVYADPFRTPPGNLTGYEFFVALLTHELGHVLGIGAESTGADDVMNGSMLRVGHPSAADIATLRHVWRQEADLRF